MVPEPYFMKNKEWYYFDEEEFMYKLTDKATLRAKKSYKEFYAEPDYKKHPEKYPNNR